MSLADRIYDAVIWLGISEREREIEISRLRAIRHIETCNIDRALIAELSRGNVRMKHSLLNFRSQHEAQLAEFMANPTPPESPRARRTLRSVFGLA